MDTMLKLYNFLTRKKEIFKPLCRTVEISKCRVGLYTCGPTVYNYAHIGNLRTYIFEDVLRRTLEYAGYKVRHVMNITDVGHLTSDADAGTDKLEEEAKKEHKNVWEVARFYTNAFLADIKLLNIRRAHALVSATSAVPEQIRIIKQLFKKGYAYDTPTAVYFHVPKFKKYSKFPRQPLKRLVAGARDEVVRDHYKRHPADFALWFKLAGRFKNHIMRWPSPWGKGFPGWHIECSAISSSRLGQPFDIHTGGVDHIFPHHTNEIAQSESAYGKALAKYWMEGEFLLIGRGKMAKSKGNFISLETLIKKGFNPLAFRYLALTAHYRSQLNFTWESLEAAQKSLERLYDFAKDLKTRLAPSRAGKYRVFDTPFPLTKGKGGRGVRGLKNFREGFQKAVFDDLDTPKALAVVWKLFHEYNKSHDFEPKEVLAALYEFDTVLGLGLKNIKQIETIPSNVLKLARERERARKAKNFNLADEIRAKIRKLGLEIKDTPSGPQLIKSVPQFFHR